jgi:hypothetical protein
MGYVRCVGRVGALAVALGVGWAAATTPVVALAEPTDSSATSSASTSAADSADSSATDKETIASSKESDATTSSEKTSIPETQTTVDDDSPPTTTSTSATDADPLSTPAASPPKTGTRNAVGTSSRSTTPVTSTLSPPQEHSATAVPKLPSPNEFHLTSTTSSTDVHPISLAAPATASSPITLTANPITTVSPHADPAPFSGPVAPLNFVTSVISSLLGWAGLGPSMTASPVAPIHEPVLWTLLAFARREIETLLGFSPTAAQPVAALTVDGPNLLVNPGAELGDPSLSGYSSVTVPGWTVTGTPTVIEYGTERRFPWPTSSPGPTFPAFLGFPSTACAPPDSGEQFFGGGPVATSTLSQIVNLSAAAADIDGGAVPYTLSGDLGGFTIDPSAASVRVEFLNASGNTIGTGDIRPVGVLDRFFLTRFLERETTGTVPVGTRAARVVVTLTDCNPVLGNYNNAYADNLSFTVGAAGLAPAPLTRPASSVGQLDHVFMVYMENKGFSDIVGSPNAPYLNGLIGNYGLASNYYALTHPSDPNYYPIIGGSDFGFNYNCPADCFDPALNLADNIELAHKTWAGYMEGGGGYSTPTDRLPFLAFHDIYDDPGRVATHLFDLSEMAGDLVVPSTAPNFVWFAADDATNMEGPTDTLAGIVQWALSQLTPKFLGGHQYNVAAGDAWLQETLPVIMDSNTWNDPTQKSAIFLTFDEDYNNISLGIGNEGNHIVTVVIPSPGAVASGMRGGAFVADDRYDHYSLLRTIEDSLGLPPLTDNDRYAQPMNEFWT